MSGAIGAFVAPGLNPATAVVLIGLSFFTSMMTAAISLGGGAMMIAAMSLVWPAAIAVPVHGVVQLGSNVGRAAHRLPYIQWGFVGWFLLGSLVGAVAGGNVAVALPDNVFKVLIAFFILYAAWGPIPRTALTSPVLVGLAGVATSAVGMIVGASGPLVAGVLRSLRDRRQIVGTHALLMSAQHIFKVIVFSALGFGFAPYLPLTLAMIASGFVGTGIGGQLLDRLPERIFRVAFRIALTLIAIDIIRRSVGF